MSLARSKITAQGQISVPAEVRKILGAGPGEILEWDMLEGHVVVRRLGVHTTEDIHKVLFPDGPPKGSAALDVKKAISDHLRKRHARR